MGTELDKGTGSSSAATAWTRPSRAMQSAGQSSPSPKEKKTKDRVSEEQEASGAARERHTLGTGRPGWSGRALEALRRSFTSAGVKWEP